MFCSQCLDKHITSQPLNRVNGMNCGELIEMQQLQRLEGIVKVMGFSFFFCLFSFIFCLAMPHTVRGGQSAPICPALALRQCLVRSVWL